MSFINKNVVLDVKMNKILLCFDFTFIQRAGLERGERERERKKEIE